MSAAAIAFLAIACLFAAMLGFAAHRASICTVRAVSEMIGARTAYMLASIGKSAVWVIALTLPILLLMPAIGGIGWGWQLTATALAGGFLFGLGAAINGACAYSTMARLVDGEVRMVVSVVGFALGIFVFAALLDRQWIAKPARTPALIGSLQTWLAVLSIVVLAWAAYELVRVWRSRPPGQKLKNLVLAPQYRLSTAALVIGAGGSIVFLLIGAPGYTITVQNAVEGLIGMGAVPSAPRWILLFAVLAGMLISTLQRGSFHVDWRPQSGWLRNLSGGAMMGLGTAMIPGGNDALVLYSIPSFSPHALPAYGALIVGAAAGLLAMKYLAGVDSRVVCRNDIYLAEAQPRGSILNSHPPRG